MQFSYKLLNTNSQVIKGLEQKNYIKRDPSADGRAKNVSLTSKGSKILKKALPAVEEADVNFFNCLKTSELNTLIQLFQELKNDCDSRNLKSCSRKG